MSKHIHIQKDGTLILNKIDFKDLFFGKVTKANDNCGHIYLPKNLIGKEVYIVVKQK